jgi:hypothetical protein
MEPKKVWGRVEPFGHPLSDDDEARAQRVLREHVLHLAP